MKVVIQRVLQASVSIDKKIVGEIKNGLLVLVGIENTDNETVINWMCNKIIAMRIFNDENGLMNKSLLDIDGNILLVSQFTLLGDAQKGNRPSFIKAAKPDIAIPIYEKMIQQFSENINKNIATGVFGADMQIALINDGPVTIVLEK